MDFDPLAKTKSAPETKKAKASTKVGKRWRVDGLDRDVVAAAAKAAAAKAAAANPAAAEADTMGDDSSHDGDLHRSLSKKVHHGKDGWGPNLEPPWSPTPAAVVARLLRLEMEPSANLDDIITAGIADAVSHGVPEEEIRNAFEKMRPDLERRRQLQLPFNASDADCEKAAQAKAKASAERAAVAAEQVAAASAAAAEKVAAGEAANLDTAWENWMDMAWDPSEVYSAQAQEATAKAAPAKAQEATAKAAPAKTGPARELVKSAGWTSGDTWPDDQIMGGGRSKKKRSKKKRTKKKRTKKKKSKKKSKKRTKKK
jgi:hypothetical protein